MRAVVITEHGGPEVLRVQERPDPPVGPGEVRIAVKAAGINFADTLARTGLYPDSPKVPCVVGYEVAGEVESVGDGVESVKPGDRVLAGTRFNGQAELVTVRGEHGLRVARAALLRGGRRLPGQLRDRPGGPGRDGRSEAGRAGPDPRRGRRGRDLGDADRQAHRSRGVRHRVGIKARRDPRAGSRPCDRLPQPGLRRGGAPDHRRRGDRRRLRRARPVELPQGLPVAAPRRAADHVRGLGGADRREAQRPGRAADRSPRARSRRCRGGRG